MLFDLNKKKFDVQGAKCGKQNEKICSAFYIIRIGSKKEGGDYGTITKQIKNSTSPPCLKHLRSMQRSFSCSVRPLITDTIINNPDMYKDATGYVEKKDNCHGHADVLLRILDRSMLGVSPKKMPQEHDAALLSPYALQNEQYKAKHFSAAAAAQYANILEALGKPSVQLTLELKKESDQLLLR